jgi:hypothetical protein
MSNFTKIRLVEAKFHADEKTDGTTERRAYMTEPIVAFRNFANAPKKIDIGRLSPQFDRLITNLGVK